MIESKWRVASVSERLLDVSALVAVLAGVRYALLAEDIAPAFVLAAGTLAVLGRRRTPIVAAVIAVVSSAFALLAPGAAVPVWVLAQVVLFSLALRRGRVTTAVAGAVHGLLLYLGSLVVFGAAPFDPISLTLPLWTAAVIAAALAIRAQSDTMHALAEQAQAAAAIREREVLIRVGEERIAIARDLHDAVAHTVAVINIQAGAAESALDRDPPRARDALRQVRFASRAVLEELQDLVSVLRSGDDRDDGLRTLASAAELPTLIRSVSTPTAPVESRLDRLPTLEPSVDAAIYRVVQESLTNARRYGSGELRVTLTVDQAEALVEVSNLVAHPPKPSRHGYGLVGMRERVASAHGTLRTGVRGEHFVVEARFPIMPTNSWTESPT